MRWVEQTMKRVSILLTSYNGEKYIEEQIMSILSQKHVQIDVFVRDDGSSDETKDILNRLSKENENVHVIFAENVGPSSSFLMLMYNTEINDYDYFAFSDQDDIWETDKIIRAIKLLEDSNQPTLYYSALNTFQEETGEKHLVVNEREYSFEETFIQSHYPGCTMVINKSGMELLRSISIPRVVIMHDLFIAQVFLATDNKIIYDKESRINYRIHGNNVSVKKSNPLDEIKRYKNIWQKQKGKRLSAAIAFNEVMGDRLSGEKKAIIKTVTEYNKTLNNKIELVRVIQHTKLQASIKMLYSISVLAGHY